MIPSISNICTNSSSNQPILQLFDDKCFKIVDKDKTTGQFCVEDFAFPADGYSCINIEVGASGGEYLIFDNGLAPITAPVPDLTADTAYARGLLLSVTYPTLDTNGDEINISDKKVIISIEDVDTGSFEDHPLYNLFTIFTNPKSNDPLDLINRIKIVNPNALFKVKIKGLIIYGKTPE